MNLHKEETLPVRRKTQLNEKFELLWPQPKVNMNEYFQNKEHTNFYHMKTLAASNQIL